MLAFTHGLMYNISVTETLRSRRDHAPDLEVYMTEKERCAHEFALMYARFALDRTNDAYASKPGETAIDYAIQSYLAAKSHFENASPR